jgi:hypothetical protein
MSKEKVRGKIHDESIIEMLWKGMFGALTIEFGDRIKKKKIEF